MSSLKKELTKRIKAYNGDVYPYEYIQQLCFSLRINRKGTMPYKLSNAERRLRPSESPDIETVYNEKGYIKGYRYEEGINLKP